MHLPVHLTRRLTLSLVPNDLDQLRRRGFSDVRKQPTKPLLHAVVIEAHVVVSVLQEREALLSTNDQAALQRAEQAGLDLVADLYSLADEGQRTHLSGRLAQLRTDFSDLKCLAPTA